MVRPQQIFRGSVSCRVAVRTARPKFVVQINDNMHSLHDYRLPVASGWTQVSIKGRASSDPIGTVAAEITYGILMKEGGINVCRLFPLEGNKKRFFGTHRFDRPGRRRLHMSTVAGLLDTGMQHDAVDCALCLWEEIAANCRVPEFLIREINGEMAIARGWK